MKQPDTLMSVTNYPQCYVNFHKIVTVVFLLVYWIWKAQWSLWVAGIAAIIVVASAITIGLQAAYAKITTEKMIELFHQNGNPDDSDDED